MSDRRTVAQDSNDDWQELAPEPTAPERETRDVIRAQTCQHGHPCRCDLSTVIQMSAECCVHGEKECEPTTPETPDTLTLSKIAERMADSDSRATAHPIYIVQQRVRDYGYDPQFDGHIAWVQADEGYEVDAEQAERLEREYRATGKEPDEFVRTCYVDRWEFVTASVSERGCEEYIRANGHNLTDPRIYVASGHRNREWLALRREIAALAPVEWGQVAAVVGSGTAHRLKDAGFTFTRRR